MVNVNITKVAEKARIANDVYNDYVNDVIKNGDEWDVTLLNELRDIANQADREMLQAKHQVLNCKHEHVSTRGMMHFSAGEVLENIREVCDDCGKVVG